MSRRDGKARMPWSVKGVSPQARDLAKSATSREGDTMGEWLSDVIRRVGAAQAAGRPVSAAGSRRGLPVQAGRRQVPVEPRVARPGYPTVASPAVPPGNPPVVQPAEDLPAETVDETALAELIAERVERSEARMVGLMQSLEDIVGRLADRLERLEQSLDDDDGGGDRQNDQRSLPRP